MVDVWNSLQDDLGDAKKCTWAHRISPLRTAKSRNCICLKLTSKLERIELGKAAEGRPGLPYLLMVVPADRVLG